MKPSPFSKLLVSLFFGLFHLTAAQLFNVTGYSQLKCQAQTTFQNDAALIDVCYPTQSLGTFSVGVTNLGPESEVYVYSLFTGTACDGKNTTSKLLPLDEEVCDRSPSNALGYGARSYKIYPKAVPSLSTDVADIRVYNDLKCSTTYTEYTDVQAGCYSLPATVVPGSFTVLPLGVCDTATITWYYGQGCTSKVNKQVVLDVFDGRSDCQTGVTPKAKTANGNKTPGVGSFLIVYSGGITCGS